MPMPNELDCLDCRRTGTTDHAGPHQVNGAAMINGEHVRFVVIWHPQAGRVRELEVAWRVGGSDA